MNPRRSPDELRFFDSGSLRVATQNVRIGIPTRLALVWESLTTDSTAILREWDDGVWFEAGGAIAYEETFPARAIVAVGQDGRLAHGDGVSYCFTIEHLADAPVTLVCRDRTPQPTGRGLRAAAVSDIPNADELPPEFRESLANIFEKQRVSEHHPSYTGMMFGEDGRLWVNAAPPEVPDLHPAVLFRIPERQPTHERWEAYEPGGDPTGGVFLPRRFTPKVFGTGEAWGFYELDTGEIVVARTSWDQP